MSQSIEALEAAAKSWEGTPFCERGRVKGAGVSCGELAAAVYIEAGWLPGDVRVPVFPVGWSRNQNKSLIVEWFNGPGSAWFGAVTDAETMRPGDLLGFRIGHVVHHLAVLLEGGRVVSALEQIGVRIATNITPTWRRRLTHIWRIK